MPSDRNVTADDAPTPETPRVSPWPTRDDIDGSSVEGKLRQNVIDALAALPVHFTSQTFIEGLEAGDLFSLNSMLGGSIEIQVVETLNRLRVVWDPDDEWSEYAFIRSSQTFPDVRLQTDSQTLIDQGKGVAIGVELKGWYLLSREGEPSFRYTVTEDACAPHDLLCVVPWHLRNVLSGKPVVYAPYVESARYAVRMRNHYWTVARRESDEAKASAARATGRKAPITRAREYYAIESPTGADVHPYPDPKAKISDVAMKDSGKNFGRVARSKGLMNEYVVRALLARVAGIQAKHWVAFFKAYSEGVRDGDLDTQIVALLTRHAINSPPAAATTLEDLLRRWGALQTGSGDGDLAGER